MKKLNESEFGDFINELQDLCHKYTDSDLMWGTEDGWSVIDIHIPREEEEQEE